MKKVLFFAAMLSFAVACGGENKNDNNAEETVVETVEAVEEQAAPEVKAEAEQTVEAPEETKLVVNKVIENANCAEVKAEEKTLKAVDATIKKEVKAEEKTLKAVDATLDKDAKKSIKKENKKNLKVTETNLNANVATAKE